MRIEIEVRDNAEAAAIRRALADDTSRAVILTIGSLLTLETDEARQRVLAFIFTPSGDVPE